MERPPSELLPFSRLLQFRTSANRKLGRARLPAPRAVFLRKKIFSPFPTESKVFGRKGNFARPIRFRKEKSKNSRETGLARQRFSSEGQRPSPERSSTGPARPAIDATGPKPERPLRLALGMDRTFCVRSLRSQPFRVAKRKAKKGKAKIFVFCHFKSTFQLLHFSKRSIFIILSATNRI